MKFVPFGHDSQSVITCFQTSTVEADDCWNEVAHFHKIHQRNVDSSWTGAFVLQPADEPWRDLNVGNTSEICLQRIINYKAQQPAGVTHFCCSVITRLFETQILLTSAAKVSFRFPMTCVMIKLKSGVRTPWKP